jgi:hypothetical protein
MKTITKNCLHCNNEFEASMKEHNRGNGNYCSRECGRKSPNRKKPIPNTTCSYCSKIFYRNNSKKKLSKSGFQFCCRKCKDSAQNIENYQKFNTMMPDHFGSDMVYREKYFRKNPMICLDCGYDKIPEIIEVHHIDGNRLNNEMSNLKSLCPTCHDTTHFLEKSGKYTKNRGSV